MSYISSVWMSKKLIIGKSKTTQSCIWRKYSLLPQGKHLVEIPTFSKKKKKTSLWKVDIWFLPSNLYTGWQDANNAFNILEKQNLVKSHFLVLFSFLIPFSMSIWRFLTRYENLISISWLSMIWSLLNYAGFERRCAIIVFEMM